MRRGRALRRRYGRAAPRVSSADVPAAKDFVISTIGGRAYSGHVPVEIRIPVMEHRTLGRSRQQLAQAAVAAKAVANYLHEIGDVAAPRWDEMSEDLLIVSGRRP